MRIGLDIDDTLLNTHKVLIKFLCKYYKLDYKKYKKERYNYFKTNCDDYYNVAMYNYERLIKAVKPKLGVSKYLKKLQKEGHHIVLISCRDYLEFKDPYKTTEEYFKEYGIPYDEMILNIRDKKKACNDANIDIFFDDDVEHCKSTISSGIDVYLMDHYTNYKNKDLKRVYNIKDIYNTVKRKEYIDGRKNNF